MREENIIVGSRKEIEDFIFSKSCIKRDDDKIITPNFNVSVQLDSAEENGGHGIVFYMESVETEDESYMNLSHVYVHIIENENNI